MALKKPTITGKTVSEKTAAAVQFADSKKQVDEKENLKRFNANLPKDLHYRLKRYAMEQDKKMGEVLVEWIEANTPSYK